MTEPECLPIISFRLPDGSIITLDHVNNLEGTVKGVRTLLHGRSVRFTATLDDWNKIQKTRLQED